MFHSFSVVLGLFGLVMKCLPNFYIFANCYQTCKKSFNMYTFSFFPIFRINVVLHVIASKEGISYDIRKIHVKSFQKQNLENSVMSYYVNSFELFKVIRQVLIFMQFFQCIFIYHSNNLHILKYFSRGLQKFFYFYIIE